MKGLFSTCFYLSFLFLQGGYSEEEKKFGHFHLNFTVSPESLPDFIFLGFRGFDFKGRDCLEKCNLSLELCFIEQKPESEHYFKNFESCEKANSTIFKYSMMVSKKYGHMITEKCTLVETKKRSLKGHTRGYAISTFAKLTFLERDEQVYLETSPPARVRGNLEAGHPHDVKVHFDFSKEASDLLMVQGKLELTCEPNWCGCWCDQLCYGNTTHNNCGDFGEKICKDGFFPEPRDMDLCLQTPVFFVEPCENYCSYKDKENSTNNEKLKELAKTQSCDACGWKTCNEPTAYYLNEASKSCEKRTCTVPDEIHCLGSVNPADWPEGEFSLPQSPKLACENLSDVDAKIDEGTGAYFKCKCEGDKKTRKYKFYSRWYYCKE